MKKEFSIYTNGFNVAIHGNKMTSHPYFRDVVLWQGDEIVATFPKHSMRKFVITHKEDIIIKAYKLTI